MRRLHVLLALPLLVPALAGCAAATPARGAPAAASTAAPAAQLRLGYLANVTSAVPIVGVTRGLFARNLGGTTLNTQVFNAGPAAVEGLFSGGLDAAYIGPNPAINAFARSHGAFVIVAGAASGGSQLVVQPGITSAAQLRGRTVASPQLGNTQDVALRSWLAGQGLRTHVSGGGDVTVAPQDNSTTLTSFRTGKIAGAWVPEPWASRLVLEGHGTVLVDERSLWPDHRFATTELVVSRRYLDSHPQTVRGLLAGELDAIDWIRGQPSQARSLINDQLAQRGGKRLSQPVLARAMGDVATIPDPLPATLEQDARRAQDLGLLGRTNLSGLVDTSLLDQVLRARSQTTGSTEGEKPWAS